VSIYSKRHRSYREAWDAAFDGAMAQGKTVREAERFADKFAQDWQEKHNDRSL
jgi:hypothetical protein